MDSAKEGVVYFSMGSNLKSSQMSPELKAIILKALGNLKQTVLWKYEEDLPGKPKNVVIRKWMPQTGILGIKLTTKLNVKLNFQYVELLYYIDSSSKRETVYKSWRLFELH